MSFSELIITLSGSDDANDESLDQAISALDSRRCKVISIYTDQPKEHAHHLEKIGIAVAAITGLRMVNLIWQIEAADPADSEAIQSISQAFSDHKLPFRVNLAVPFDADYFERSTDKSSSTRRLLHLSRGLMDQGLDVRWLLPIHPDFLFRIEALYYLAKDEHAEPVLMMPDQLDDVPRDTTLTPDEVLFAWDFITYRLLETDLADSSSQQRNYYQRLIDVLYGRSRQSSTAVATVRAATDGGWEVRHAEDTSFGLRMLALDAVDGEKPAVTRWRKQVSVGLDVAGVLQDAVRAYWQRIRVRKSAVKKVLEKDRFEKVLLIGAYGGEHIGDAAILGGVLCRLHDRFGTTEATLMTQRVNHTRHLIPMLDVPVTVSVDEYEHRPIRKHLDEADAVVFAGGPLVDIPKQLVRHLYTVSLAHRLGKPFLAEGIGPGPFTRPPSLITARRMIELAGAIKVRTSDSARHNVLTDLDVQVGRCPAFDYLETRSKGLTRLPSSERDAIEQLLAGTEDRPVIAINIRPIGHLHTIGAPDRDLAGFTRHIEDRFERRFAEGMRQFDESSTRKPCFIYFPMNAIQFGSSDILSAYRLSRSLAPDVDFRVWQGDISLDGVVGLLRRVDVAITMRFHATIFAMSQGCQVIGVDYRIGKRDKVAELLDDAGQGENCERIDLLTSEWLASRLKALTGDAKGARN